MTWLDYALSAVTFGIGDSWNPYMLAVVLCFLTFLASVGDTVMKIKLAGRSFIAVMFLGTCALSREMDVWWLNARIIDAISRFSSLGVAAVLLTIGYLLFQHRRQDKKKTGRRWLPLFLEEDRNIEETVAAGKRRQKNVGILFFSVILGLGALALLSLWPQDRNIYPILYTLLFGGNALLAVLFFAMYSLAFVFPLIVVYRIILQVRCSARLRRRLINAISWLDVSFSAFFIAAGLGLIYLFTIT